MKEDVLAGFIVRKCSRIYRPINDSLIVIYPKRHEGRPVGLDSQIALDVAILG